MLGQATKLLTTTFLAGSSPLRLRRWLPEGTRKRLAQADMLTGCSMLDSSLSPLSEQNLWLERPYRLQAGTMSDSFDAITYISVEYDTPRRRCSSKARSISYTGRRATTPANCDTWVVSLCDTDQALNGQ